MEVVFVFIASLPIVSQLMPGYEVLFYYAREEKSKKRYSLPLKLK